MYIIFLFKMNFKSVIFLSCFAFCEAWFWGGGQESKDKEKEKVFPPETKVPFEMKTTDEKFLLQAKFTKDLSPLDACHHRVIAELTETCSRLSEEDLGKLAVQLLNCQSEVEKRKVFPCTQNMNIADCTKDMDSTTWNAYQIVSNRARAICYQARQQQFRMKTEYTVNHLVHTAEQQLNTMHLLKEGQSDLIEAATDSLKQIKSDQTHLISQHEKMKSHQTALQSSVATTLRDLYKEKALIASGQKELEMLASQNEDRHHNHKEILDDLLKIKGRTKDVWQKIDDNNQQVLHFQKETKDHYAETLENLERVNHTVNYVVRLVNETRHSFDRKLNWVLSLLGSSGDRLAFVTTVVLHIMYFLLAAISASFLNTPVFTRILLLLLVPVNAWSEVKQGRSLGFLAMSLFIVLSTTANWIVGWMCYLVLFKKKDTGGQCNNNYLTYPAMREIGAGDCGASGNGQVIETITAAESSQLHNNQCDKGLSKDDVQKLMTILQRMHDSGMLPNDQPDSNLLTPAESIPDQAVPVNTPISANEGQKRSKFTFADVPLNLGSTAKSDMKTSSHIKGDYVESVLPSPRVELVKRQLMRTLITDNNTDSEADLLNSSGPPTPGNSRPGTPHSTPNNTPKRPRKSDILNKSGIKPQCLATTKAGMPCKNTCVEGSGFCFRHQALL